MSNVNKNLFKNVKFGDRFRTRSGDVAVYLGEGDYSSFSLRQYIMQTENSTSYYVDYCGKTSNYEELDIVEKIDNVNACNRNVTIDKIAELYANNIVKNYKNIVTIDRDIFKKIIYNAYRTGYLNN